MRRTLLAMAASLTLLGSTAAHAAKPKDPPPVLPSVHTHPSGAFSFATPTDWTVAPLPGRPDVIQALGGNLIVRYLFRDGEVGFDSLHGACMLELLAGPMDTAPESKYEYDYVEGVVLERRALDSAFVVVYDAAILGSREWRQRNLTVVGKGQSLCIVTYAPAALWKKSKETRALLDAIVMSLTFR